MKWIYVQDKLPETTKKVLVRNLGEVHKAYYEKGIKSWYTEVNGDVHLLEYVDYWAEDDLPNPEVQTFLNILSNLSNSLVVTLDYLKDAESHKSVEEAIESVLACNPDSIHDLAYNLQKDIAIILAKNHI